MTLPLFRAFVALHVLGGATALLTLWAPLLARKGGSAHRRWGGIAARAMMLTGVAGFGVGAVTMVRPLETHLTLHDPVWIRGVFGWMMMFLAVLTFSLAWHGRELLRQGDAWPGPHRGRETALQLVVLLFAIACCWQGWVIRQPLLPAMALLGFATANNNLTLLRRAPLSRVDRTVEHVKACVGASAAVCTAFLAVGLVRLLPKESLHPGWWSLPIVAGLSLSVYYERRLRHAAAPTPRAPRAAGRAAVPPGPAAQMATGTLARRGT
ncbi:MAG: hypothetical protein NW201_14495 [Gemmatimonadales bacterium]|nr:hypothetical protein [Gemmatimonadales bacterium]